MSLDKPRGKLVFNDTCTLGEMKRILRYPHEMPACNAEQRLRDLRKTLSDSQKRLEKMKMNIREN